MTESLPKLGLLHLREFSLMYLELMQIPLIMSTTVVSQIFDREHQYFPFSQNNGAPKFIKF